MSNLGTAGLIMSYVVLATLLLCLHLYANWKWWAKAGVTIAIAILYFTFYSALPQMLGWPTSSGLPEKFRLVAYNFKDRKHIFIWAKEIQGGTEQPKPRSYVLPYTPSLQKKVAQAGQRMKAGITIIGEVDDASNSTTPRDAESTAKRTEQLSITFEDAPGDNNLTKD